MPGAGILRSRRVTRAFDALYARFGRRYVPSDPIGLVHRLRDAGVSPAGLEIAAFYASSLAYGPVQVIRAKVERLFAVLGLAPDRFVLAFEPRTGERLLAGFSHRFHKSRDLALLTWLLRQALERHGTLEAVFLVHDEPAAPDIGAGLAGLARELLAGDVSPFHPDGVLPAQAPVRHFLPSPEAGSACKRLCLFLRWMVRRLDPDLGLWRSVDPARLVVPLDTHVARLGLYLGLTGRKSGGWKAAQQVSAALRRLDPHDPLRFDFPLAHLGIHHCRHRPDPEACPACPVLPACSLGLGRPAETGQPWPRS
jgi:uncharacterized protein (TIGR02757 family)